MSEPKEYQVRLIDPDNPAVNLIMDAETNQTWSSLDGKRVEFSNPCAIVTTLSSMKMLRV
jgi:hypothetical protein